MFWFGIHCYQHESEAITAAVICHLQNYTPLAFKSREGERLPQTREIKMNWRIFFCHILSSNYEINLRWSSYSTCVHTYVRREFHTLLSVHKVDMWPSLDGSCWRCRHKSTEPSNRWRWSLTLTWRTFKQSVNRRVCWPAAHWPNASQFDASRFLRMTKRRHWCLFVFLLWYASMLLNYLSNFCWECQGDQQGVLEWVEWSPAKVQQNIWLDVGTSTKVLIGCNSQGSC